MFFSFAAYKGVCGEEVEDYANRFYRVRERSLQLG